MEDKRIKDQKKLQILLLEDDPEFANLENALLVAEGLDCDITRVETKEDFVSALDHNSYDLILSDYELPTFDGGRALEVARGKCPDVPFIFVSGVMSEDLAIESLRNGATDYVFKQKLSRLVPAVFRALKESETRLQQRRSDEARRLQEAYFQQLFENSPEGIAILDTNDRVVVVNKGFQKLFMYSAEEVVGKQLSDLIVPAELRQEALNLSGSVLDKKDVQVDTVRQRRDGSRVHVSVLGFPITLGDSQIGVYGIYRDISLRKQAEQEIQKLAAFPRFNPNAVMELNETGNVDYYNEAAGKMAQSMGKSEPAGILPQDITRIAHECLTSERGVRHLETTIGQHTISWSFFPVRSSQAVHCYALDVTERKRAERLQSALYQIAEKANVENDLRTLCASIHGIIAELMEAKNFYIALHDENKHRLGFPYYVDEVAEGPPSGNWGKGLTEYVLKTGETLLADPEIINNLIARREIEVTGRIPVDWLGVPLRSATKVLGVLVVQSYTENLRYGQRERDILSFVSHHVANALERKQAEEQLSQRNEELEHVVENLKKMQNTLVQSEKMASIGQLTAGIAHEINNPLAFVSSNLNRFQEYFEDTVSVLKEWQILGSELSQLNDVEPRLASIRAMEVQRDLEFVTQDFETLMRHTREGADRIKSIVERLRGFSHLASTGFSEASINDALDDTIAIVWNELKYKATIKKEYGELRMVSCNSGEIKQVFVNLLVNAAHAINEKGEILIRTGQNGSTVFIQITDSGCGIVPANMKKIFDPFFTTKPVGKGTGLGLWISSTIIQKHAGTMTVESEPGRGTTFTITLPIQQEQEARAA